MSLAGKKVGVLMESDFYEDEIFYYKHRFPEDGIELHFLTRLWGQPRITFHGHEYKVPFEVSESFEGMSDEELRSYSAIIVPSAIVSDRLRYTEDVTKLPPATEFLARAFAEKDIIKGIICHGMWLVAPMPELIRGRPVVAHNNLHGDVVNMGAIYTDQDVVIDGDLVTGRTGGHCHLFARAIIDLIAAKDPPSRRGGWLKGIRSTWEGVRAWPRRRRRSRRRGLSGRRDDSQLAHHPEVVAIDPALGQPATVDPVDHRGGHLDGPSRRRDAEQIALVGAGGRPAAGDHVTLGDDPVDVHPDVGKRRAEHHVELLEALPTGPQPGDRLVVDEVVGDELVVDRQIVRVPALVVEALDERSVFSGRHACASTVPLALSAGGAG